MQIDRRRPADTLPVHSAPLPARTPSFLQRAMRRTGNESGTALDEAPRGLWWRLLHGQNVGAAAADRHLPAAYNPFHPSHAAHPERPYVPTDGDRANAAIAASGVQQAVLEAEIWAAVALLLPLRNTLFNPSDTRLLASGVLVLALAPSGCYAASYVANVTLRVVQATCRNDTTFIADHPRSARVGAYTVATASALVGLVGCGFAFYQALSSSADHDPGGFDRAMGAAIGMQLATTFVPACGWYAGQAVGGLSGAALARVRPAHAPLFLTGE